MKTFRWIAAVLFAMMANSLAFGQTLPVREHVALVPQLGMDWITGVAFSPDGKYVFAGSYDFTARLWDVAGAREMRIFTGHTDAVLTVAYSPDGKTVLTGSGDQTARLWNVATGETIRTLTGFKDWVYASTFSHDGHLIVFGSGRTASLWDTATGKQLRIFEGHTGPITCVAFSPDDRWIATGSIDKTVRLWDAATGTLIRSFAEPGSTLVSVAFSPDGRAIAAGSQDNTARIWNVESGQMLHTFQIHDDKWDSIVTVTDEDNDADAQSHDHNPNHSLVTVAYSPDGRYLLTASSDKFARLWDTHTGQNLRTFEGHTGGIYTAAYAPDGRHILTGSEDTSMRLWDTETGTTVRTFESKTAAISSAVFSGNGRYILTGGDDHLVRLWETASGQQVRVLEGHEAQVQRVSFSPDSRLILTSSQDESARVWNTETGEQLRLLDGHDDSIFDAVFSRDQRYVLTGGRDHIARLWDVSTGNVLRTFEGHTKTIGSVALSPDNRLAATGGDDGTARLWDVAAGKQIGTLRGQSDMMLATLSPDGHFGATGGSDGSLWLWDLTKDKHIRTFTGHTGSIASIVFSSDSKLLLTGSSDRTARMWEVSSGKQLRVFEGHTNTVISAEFSPDGRFVLTGSWDTTTWLWNAATGKKLVELIGFANGGWAVVDPEGRFDTNDLDGNAPLVWVVDSEPMRPLPLEIFMRDYYTPGLLARILRGDKLAAVRSIAEIPNRVQPEVRVVSVTPSKIQRGRVDVLVHAQSATNQRGENSGVQDLRVFRNGQLVGHLEGALKDGDYPFADVQLPLGRTKATFTSYAFSSERIKSPTATLDYDYQPYTNPKPRAYLVQIGVNHYQASNCELQGAVNDARRLNELLTDRLTAKNYEVVPYLLLSTSGTANATKEDVRKALTEIASVATPDDAFFLSFSGHGYSSPEGKFYMMPSSIQGSCMAADAELLRGAISADELAEWLRPIDAGEMTFVLDSCYSAQSVEANDFKPGPMGSQGLGQLAYDKRIRILAASQSDATAAEDNQLHMGLLTYELTEQGLVNGKADWRPVDRKITVGEWLGYAAKEVPLFREEAEKNRGLAPMGSPAEKHQDLQVPVVFDFAKTDTMAIQ